ncbi:MAG: hypothetical protein AB7Q97_26015 [Gammaproteobacteria bacterium]
MGARRPLGYDAHMARPIRISSSEHGVYYRGTREQLINTGLATREMFPGRHEAWRGNGLVREADEPLWSVQRAEGGDFIVMWGLCVEPEVD